MLTPYATVSLPNVGCETVASSKHAEIRHFCGKTPPNFLLHAQEMDKYTLLHIHGKFQLRAKGVTPTVFFEVANFRQNPMTSHFAETPPPWPQRSFVGD